MERPQPVVPRNADFHVAGQAARQQPDAGELRRRVSAECVCRWLADDGDELDLVVIRTWN